MIETIGFAELTGVEARRLREAHPEIGSPEAALVIAAPRPVLDKIKSFAEQMLGETEAVEQLLSAMSSTPAAKGIDEHRLVQIKRQAEARSWFESSYRCLSSSEVAALSGSTARNSAAKANRLKGEGKIFAIPGPKGDRFPLFQFSDEGAPYPIVAEVLAALAGKSPWSIALWFVSPNGWLDGERPVDLLEKESNRIASAAQRATEPVDA